MASRSFPSLIGVIHLPPLGGSPAAEGLSPAEALQRAGQVAVREAVLLQKAGFEGLIVENLGDVPFFSSSVPPETVAQMAIIAAAVREVSRVPLGINILRNASSEALAVAASCGADFIRVNVLSGVAATDQGWVEGKAAVLLRERARLNAAIQILADVHVKHAKTFSSDDPVAAAEDTVARAGADGLIVSGSGTGKPTDPARVEAVARVARSHGVPIFVGSGATVSNLDVFRQAGAGVIVSSSLRRAGRAGAPLDSARVKAFVQAWRKAKPSVSRRRR